MCLNKQDSKYAWGPNYTKTSEQKLGIWQGSQYASFTQPFEYCQNMPWQSFEYILVVNKPGFWMWQGCEYARVTQGSKYAKIWLNMSE